MRSSVLLLSSVVSILAIMLVASEVQRVEAEQSIPIALCPNYSHVVRHHDGHLDTTRAVLCDPRVGKVTTKRLRVRHR